MSRRALLILDGSIPSATDTAFDAEQKAAAAKASASRARTAELLLSAKEKIADEANDAYVDANDAYVDANKEYNNAKNDSDSKVTEGKCCHNESFTLQSVDDSNTSNSLQLANVDLTFVTVFILNSIYLFDSELEVDNYFNYSFKKVLMLYINYYKHTYFLFS